MAKKIGVVIATYNGEKYIEEQLNSVICQKLRPDLIVVTDGGSSDRTVDKCNNLLSKSAIEYKILISSTRLSVQDNFNRGLEVCDTDYVFFSDQDDVWDEDKTNLTIKKMEENNASMSFSNAVIVDDSLHPIGRTLWESVGFSLKSGQEVLKKSDGALFHLLLKKNVVTGMTVCVKKELVEKMIPFSSYELHDKWIALLGSVYTDVVAINKPLVLYRQHCDNVVGTEGSLSKTIQHRVNYYKNIQNRKQMICEMIRKLQKEDITENYITELKSYSNFLEERLLTMKKKTFVLWLVKQIKQYKRYEDNYKQIIFKDLYIWLFRNKLI